MKVFFSILSATCLGLILGSTAHSQTLAATIQFIQQTLASQGRLTFGDHAHDNSNGKDWTVSNTFELTNVRVSLANCQINFHDKVTVDNRIIFDAEGWIPFRQVQDVVILPIEQDWKEIEAKSGYTTRTYLAIPSVFVVRTQRQNGTVNNDFNFFDKALAIRVQQAMIRAAQLCRGAAPPQGMPGTRR
jgi:hypothetical protein